MSDIKTGIVSTPQGFAVIFDGIVDHLRFNDRQDAKRHLQELYSNPQLRPRKPKAQPAAQEDQ